MGSGEWINGFLKKFVRRLGIGDFPEPGTDEFVDLRDDWIEALDRRSISEAQADMALRRLREGPPQWQREHLPKFLEAVEAIRKERQAESSASDRETAEAASRGCVHCGGSGQATVYHPRFDGRSVYVAKDLEGHEVRFAARVVAHCSCPMGRWMRSKTDIDTLRRIPDLLDVLAGRSRWLTQDPRGEDPPPRGRVPSVEAMKRDVGVNVGSRGGR